MKSRYKTHHGVKTTECMNVMLNLITLQGRLFLIASPLLALLGLMDYAFPNGSDEAQANIIRGSGGFLFGWVVLWFVKKTRAYLERNANGY